MKTRKLSRGMVEAYNERLRIRLQPSSDPAMALVTIFELKPNGYTKARRVLHVSQPITIEQLIAVYGAFAEAA
ncbi:MAG: hypothetical protein ACRBG0_21795 [Lewinella sp.]|jgi:hypothetical protein|uniref:hypothetical protein n=1 Tax=Lewinella sp. TaxID=2004506 RepID=UPI003D6A2AAE